MNVCFENLFPLGWKDAIPFTEQPDPLVRLQSDSVYYCCKIACLLLPI